MSGQLPVGAGPLPRSECAGHFYDANTAGNFCSNSWELLGWGAICGMKCGFARETIVVRDFEGPAVPSDIEGCAANARIERETGRGVGPICELVGRANRGVDRDRENCAGPVPGANGARLLRTTTQRADRGDG